MDHESSQPSPHRFHREVNAASPKPGHHLASIAFERGECHYLLWMIEGPENDVLSFRGMANEKGKTSFFRYKLQGSIIEALSELPYSPWDRKIDVEYSGADVQTAQVVFSSVRAPNGKDPDAALACYVYEQGELRVSLHELRRAWSPTLIAISTGLALPGAVVRGTDKAGMAEVVLQGDHQYHVMGDYELTAAVAGGIIL